MVRYFILKTDNNSNIHDIVGSMLFEITEEQLKKLEKKLI